MPYNGSMKILFAGFGGKYNSSKILLDHLECPDADKLCLVISYKTSVRQLEEKLASDEYDYAVVLGQWGRVPAGTLRLETQGQKGRYAHRTTFPVQELADELRTRGYEAEISEFAGRWLCNNVYFYGLKYLERAGSSCKMVFIHVPKHKEIQNYAKLARDLVESVEAVSKKRGVTQVTPPAGIASYRLGILVATK